MLWNGPKITLALLAFLLWVPASPSLAGESFLDLNPKVHEAVPYGRSIDPPASPTPEARAGQRAEDDPDADRDSQPPDSQPP